MVKETMTAVFINVCGLHCVIYKVTLCVSVTIVISEWEGCAHEGSHVKSNHVLLHSTELLGSISMVNYRMQ